MKFFVLVTLAALTAGQQFQQERRFDAAVRLATPGFFQQDGSSSPGSFRSSNVGFQNIASQGNNFQNRAPFRSGSFQNNNRFQSDNTQGFNSRFQNNDNQFNFGNRFQSNNQQSSSNFRNNQFQGSSDRFQFNQQNSNNRFQSNVNQVSNNQFQFNQQRNNQNSNNRFQSNVNQGSNNQFQFNQQRNFNQDSNSRFQSNFNQQRNNRFQSNVNQGRNNQFQSNFNQQNSNNRFLSNFNQQNNNPFQFTQQNNQDSNNRFQSNFQQQNNNRFDEVQSRALLRSGDSFGSFDASVDGSSEPLNLPSGASFLLGSISSSFSCVDRPYGYYADEENSCRVFHVCNPSLFSNGEVQTYQYSFMCGEGTVFDQEKLTCVSESEASPCFQSSSFLFTNEEFGRPQDKNL